MKDHIKYYSSISGYLYEEQYFKDGLLHREDGPAYIAYNVNGTIQSEKYFINGKLHRVGEPAIIRYLNEKIFLKIYCLNNYYHNVNGPAKIEYGLFFNKKSYYFKGKQFNSLKEIKKYQKKLLLN